VSFSNGTPVERFDPEGPKNPKGERRSVGRKRQLGWVLGNGQVALKSPRLGQTELG